MDHPKQYPSRPANETYLISARYTASGITKAAFGQKNGGEDVFAA